MEPSVVFGVVVVGVLLGRAEVAEVSLEQAEVGVADRMAQ